jgi:hypothetical protein
MIKRSKQPICLLSTLADPVLSDGWKDFLLFSKMFFESIPVNNLFICVYIKIELYIAVLLLSAKMDIMDN